MRQEMGSEEKTSTGEKLCRMRRQSAWWGKHRCKMSAGAAGGLNLGVVLVRGGCAGLTSPSR